MRVRQPCRSAVDADRRWALGGFPVPLSTVWAFVPLRDAQLQGDSPYVAYDEGQVKDAPNVDPTVGIGGW